MYGILEHDRITLTIGYVNVTILCRMLRSGVPIKVESISICYPSSMQCKLRQAVDYILIDLTKKLAERKRTAYREPMQGGKTKRKTAILKVTKRSALSIRAGLITQPTPRLHAEPMRPLCACSRLLAGGSAFPDPPLEIKASTSADC